MQRVTLAAVLALFLLVGVPLWLQTTTVYRADLPLDRMLVDAPPQVCVCVQTPECVRLAVGILRAIACSQLALLRTFALVCHEHSLPLTHADTQLVLPVSVSLDLGAMEDKCGVDAETVAAKLAGELAERRSQHAINLVQEQGKGFVDVRCDVSLAWGG